MTKREFKKKIFNGIDYVQVKRMRYLEKRKFQDPRRKAIYDQIQLTKEQMEQIDELYVKNYGSKIPYIWHRHFTAFTGKFDPGYLPELLFIPEFEHFQNLDEKYLHVYQDKNVLPLMAKLGGVNMPNTILSGSCGILHDADMKEIDQREAANILYDAGEVFIKPSVNSDSGEGCFIVDLEHGKDSISDKSVEEILGSVGTNFVIQEKIRCHESISKIYPTSVNTFRIITYRWKDKVMHMPIIMRVGQGGNYLDNAHAGGMFVALDDDGTMHDTAYTEFRQEYKQHPDTSVIFKGQKIDLLPEVIAAAEKMCTLFPQVGCIHWDFTIDDKGQPTLIEANMRHGGIWIVEMAHGCGPFGELTEEVLRWMKFMKASKASDRERFRFGKM